LPKEEAAGAGKKAGRLGFELHLLQPNLLLGQFVLADWQFRA
jgi:hypothetical protein